MKIGFIGLGNLGTPIAENLLESYGTLHVYNRTASKAQPLLNKGATLCASIKELCNLCDVVCSIVSDDAALLHITEGEEGIAANLQEGGLHISISTVLPATSTHIAALHQQHNNHFIASPVMGRPEAARAKKLNFLVAGNANAIETAKPVLMQAGAAGVWHFGDNVANANVAKLCSNFMIISAIKAMAEGIDLAQKSGVDASAWMHMLTQTLFTSPVYVNYSNIILKEAYQPAGFSLKLGLKDVNLVMQQAAETSTSMHLGHLLQHELQQCVANGYGDYDWTAIALASKAKD